MMITIKVKTRLPSYNISQDARDGKSDDGTGIGAAKGQGRQPGPLQRRGPVSPHAVTGRIRHSLHQTLKYADQHGHRVV